MSNSRLRKQQQPRALRNILPTPVILVLGGVVLIAGALFALWKSGQPATPKVPVEVNGSPRLKVDRETVDLGDVPLDKTRDGILSARQCRRQNTTLQQAALHRSLGRVLTACTDHRCDGPQARRTDHPVDELYDACRHGRHARFPRAYPQ